MKKTYITTLPDEAGAFLTASRIIAAVGGNITRASYNKAVDTHTLFIDVEATEEEHEVITENLRSVGYIQHHESIPQVMLLDFRLEDVPGAIEPVLELISGYHFNISYINTQENGTGYQNLRMGLFIEDPAQIKSFLDEAAKLCQITVVEYDSGETVLDNTVFYMSFVNSVVKKLDLAQEQSAELMTQSNRLMQMLDQRQEPPARAFDSISRAADLLAQYRGRAFVPRISQRLLSDGFDMYVIEPPCGSNLYILRRGDELLFIDTGLAIYAGEMDLIFHRLFPNFDTARKRAIVTHPDVDHCGLLGLFDEIYVSRTARENFRLENDGEPNFREQDAKSAPYCRIYAIISKYRPPRMDALRVVEGIPDDPAAPICAIGSVDFCGRRLDVYRGNGGHEKGEIVIVDETDKMVFSGDIEVNIHGFTPPQAAYNQLGPYLMTSVNLDSALASAERKYLLGLFSPDEYWYCGGHGEIMPPKKAL